MCECFVLALLSVVSRFPSQHTEDASAHASMSLLMSEFSSFDLFVPHRAW
jgi:hypothetical protein